MNIDTLQLLIPAAVAASIAGIKALWPKLPKFAPLILAPVLPALADAVAGLANYEGVSTGQAALLGLLAVYLREVIDQSRKALTPKAPPVVT